MGTVILIAILGAAFFLVGAGLMKLADLVTGDGASERRTPPRSHHLDEFDPRSRAA
jgi:hypothetical protein